MKEKIIGLEKDSFLLNNRSGSAEKRHSITYQFYCAVLLFLHAGGGGTRYAAVGVIAVHLLEHAVLADDRPHIPLIAYRLIGGCCEANRFLVRMNKHFIYIY